MGSTGLCVTMVMLSRKFQLGRNSRWSFKTGLNAKTRRWLAALLINQKILALGLGTRRRRKQTSSWSGEDSGISHRCSFSVST